MRCQAATVSSAQGQVARIFSCRLRPPRLILGGGVQDAVALGLGLGSGQGTVGGEQPQPGQQGRGDQRVTC